MKLGLTDSLVSELSSFDMLHQCSTECKGCASSLWQVSVEGIWEAWGINFQHLDHAHCSCTLLQQLKEVKTEPDVF